MPRLPLRLAFALPLAAFACHAFALDVAGLDASADPCADFYRYANGRWIEATPIPADRPGWGTFTLVYERNEKILAAALLETRDKPPPAGTAQRKVAEFFASGMDEEAIARAGLRPLEPLMARVAQTTDAASLARTLAFLQSRGINAGFVFFVRPDARDSTRYVADIEQAGLGLPERDYYFKEDARSVRIREAYAKSIARILQLAGDEAEGAQRSAAAILAFETELARASMNAVERRDVDRTENRMRVAELAAQAPGFPWAAYFAAAGAPDLAELNVGQPAFFKAFARRVADAPPADWRAYLRWQILRSTADKLAAPFEQAHFEFYEALLRGRASPLQRPYRVIDVIGGRIGTEPMGHALGMVFVDRAFSAQAKARSLELVAHIKAALTERLATLDWMSEDTRRRALEKIAAMQVKMGYPDKWRDYSDADVGPYPFVENWMRAKEFFHRRDIRRIGQPVDRTEWGMSPHVVNASYNGRANEITFPAGILQPPFFDANADDAVNYGGIGMVIGHEITHGFDDRGRRFDAKGNLTDWWTAEDARRYVERAARVERQYDGYVGVESVNVNGKLTLGENISDIGGAKLSYLALTKALKEHPQGKVEGLTPEQRFFLSFAQIWRSRARVEQERLQLQTDGHSPARFRVLGTISNMPEFARAYSCDASKAILSESERANIW
jgi:predicted metalloendopeptidase